MTSEPGINFGEIVEFAIGGGWGSDDDGEVPVIVIRGTDFVNARHGDLAGCPTRYETRKRAERRAVRPGDILLEISGGSKASGQTTGRSLLVTNEIASNNGQVVIPASFSRLVRLDQTRVLPRYAYYHLRDMYLSGRAGQYENQSTGISNFQFKYFLQNETIRLPDLAEQRRIAWVLGSLDDKIESNRRIARTLEEIAATLFKARFVDFIDHDDLVESEIGPIPRGWPVTPIGEIGSVHRKLTDGSSGLPYVGLDTMPRGSTVLIDWQTDKAPIGQSAKFAVGDILFGKLRPYFRKVGVAPIEGRCSTEILVLRPNDPAYHGFLLGHVSSQRFIDHCVAVSRGTRMPRSEWRDAGTFTVAVPPREIASTFNVVTADIYEWILAAVHELRTLSALRDALLPKLISGELRVDQTDSAEVAA